MNAIKSKKKIYIFLLTILGLGLIISVSFSYFIFTLDQTNLNRVQSKCLDFEMVNQKNEINLQNVYPISDDEGKKLVPFTFTVKNTCNSYMSYSINLELLEGTTLPEKYVKVMINTEGISNLDDIEVGIKSMENSVSSRVLGKYSLGADEESDFTLRIWMDENTPTTDDSMNKIMLSKIVINASMSTFDPITLGINKLHDAILANEYQVVDIDFAKDKIAAKGGADTTKTSPIIEWDEYFNPSIVTINVILPDKSLIGTDFDVTEEETQVRLGKNYKFNSETGNYDLLDYDYYNPMEIKDYNTNDYYFCNGGHSINSSNKISTSHGTNNCSIIYKVTGVKIDSSTTTNTSSYTGIEYAVTKYIISGQRLTQVELEVYNSDRGLYQSIDDFGTTYYYRGNVKNNYVSFAGFYWQIIRINGDGSIRMLYAGKSADFTNMDTYIDNVVFNNLKDNPAYLGYMYGNNLNSSLKETQANEVDSNVKKELEIWYEKNILDKGYNRFVADSGFCNDRTLSNRNNNGDGVTTTNHTYYAANDRYYLTKIPTYICSNAINDLFTTTTSTFGNKAAKYPIGLITIDELMYAGLTSGYKNNLSYVYQNVYYWTMSPSYFYATYLSGAEFSFYSTGNANDNWVTNRSGLRPVINLKSDVLISGGIGTLDNPYVIEQN